MEMDGEGLYNITDGKDRSTGKMQLHVANSQYRGLQMSVIRLSYTQKTRWKFCGITAVLLILKIAFVAL